MRLLTLAAITILFALTPAKAETVNIFAAASLKTALDQVLTDWKQTSGKDAKAIYAGTPALAKQIAEGAPADIFISADEAWMDDLSQKGLIRPETRSDFLGNTLVLVVPSDTSASLDLNDSAALTKLLGNGRLAVADTKSVPAGKYAKSALESLGSWDAVKDRLAESENVRTALLFVARGEAPAGIVYGSDAKAESQVKVAATFPATSHPPIRYPVAIIASSHNPDAQALVAFLLSEQAKANFASAGFVVLE